jgi:predicted metal-dependent hydrolase
VGERVATHAERLDLSPTSVAIHEWRARWGDCQPNGSVRFHWRFAMLPPAALDYVVVHELVHLREFNHSARFWRLLTQPMPEAKQWRAWFNVYGSPYLSWSAKLEPDTRSRVRDRDDLALAR